MTFDEFFTANNGKSVETEDPTNLYQCMDLAFAWCDAMGVPRETIRHLNAFEVWTQPIDITLQYFDFIPNTPMGAPKAGDLVIFNQGVGPSGHISIATGNGDPKGFTSFDQNWNGVASAQLVNHIYTDVYGWLHKKEAQVDAFLTNVATELQVPATEDAVMNKLDTLVSSHETSVQKDEQISSLLSQVSALQGTNSTETNNMNPPEFLSNVGQKIRVIAILISFWRLLEGKKTVIVGMLMMAIGLLQGDWKIVLEGLGIIGLRATVLGNQTTSGGPASSLLTN